MAIISAALIQRPTAPDANSHLSGGMGGLEGRVGWPVYAVDSSPLHAVTLTDAFPVSAGLGSIAVEKRISYVDDFYNRIHISPKELRLGNVASTQSVPVYIWNAYFETRTLEAIEGLDEGVLLDGEPEPPLLFGPLQEREWQLSVTPAGQPTLDLVIDWQFSGGDVVGLHVTANRIVAWAFVPDWQDGILERLTFATDILQSESAVEQRRAIRLAPRREFEAPMYVEGRERQLLDLMLFGWGERLWALPIWHEIQLLQEDLAIGADFIPCSTEHLDFHADGLALLRSESAFVCETVEVDEVTPAGLQLKRSMLQGWPAGSRLYPARTAQLVEQPSLTRLTDQAIQADVRFLVMEPCDWPAVLPSTLYRGRPVFDATPDESEDLSATFARLTSTFDQGGGLPLTTDTAARGLTVLGQRWLDLGRAARGELRSFIYAMNGRQKAVWVPTHAGDLTLAGTVTSVATVIDIDLIGYTRFAAARPGRRDIRIQLTDGAVFFRRILAATELDADTERLSLNAALGRLVEPSDVARISWMVCCRFDSDTVEIEHQTDSEGVASSAFTFRETRDDEL
ncbi:hypothetical protein B6S59_25460 [Pseudomonas sp. A46]|nr:hypothetical protein [Pseudomonas sp. A46]OWJ91122.1 hypothetical protein B6S59_25460 [Pseudomonas sp. A46]